MESFCTFLDDRPQSPPETLNAGDFWIFGLGVRVQLQKEPNLAAPRQNLAWAAMAVLKLPIYPVESSSKPDGVPRVQERRQIAHIRPHNLVVEAEIGRLQFWILTHAYSGRYRPYCHSGNQEHVELTAETGQTPKATVADLGRHEPAYGQIYPSEPKPARRYESTTRTDQPYLHGALAPQRISSIVLRHDPDLRMGTTS
ncbi:uncharacterized protein FPOAC1_013583 [Fusarium poae]|uniref:uncharacterized protein n=1 Tax=Fusarium poae TaxID=36050 RepID=UPI001D05931E|nr:uncharacterized protein FPOAC1_013840 [Fusarium poae]XP_044701029.1 uncharacterized protein FPOAC1_013865 [Fusarium poae]XP_044701288.1 uncharacterized protein FPOAC1_013565 [Fusarium poae]XP_044701306.1 uncharacterized protein FPOAC1_013583 [Fusarium poae]KAG8664501.1 hypothetical protein FPOAC1_013840 [Fusarium poae]KAG8664526.1 hypothetical protein FPOAC1_013865 [Fusarium poae]KAG8664785.1 hypothetical protein FPOAC1_013565 [Fusarium poae]KAG8664803.1 hypothetical protein FPOAC1_013583